MARRRKSRKPPKPRWKGRRTRKPRKYARRSKALTMGARVFPKTMLRKLVYYIPKTDNYATQGSTVVFRANALHDPEYAILGHQPRGYDQIMEFYKRYTVLSAKIHVTSQWTAGQGAKEPMNIIIATRDTSTAYAGSEIMNSYLENPDRSLKTLSPIQSYPTRTTRSVSIRKRLGVTDVNDSQELGASSGANPVKEVFFHFHVGPVDPGVLTTDDITHQIRIEYVALFTEPVTIGQS